MTVPEPDSRIGIEIYATKTRGIGGRIKQFPEDFRVEEILKDGSRGQVEQVPPVKIEGRGRYLLCVLVKRNFDTILAVQTVAKKLYIEPDRIHIAGIKDARALTAQHVSISRMLPEQTAQISLKNLQLHPLRFSNEKIGSDLLFGNHFAIRIRDISCSDRTMCRRVESAEQELVNLGGCPNFFGHQRFGTIRPITHRVGKRILFGEWEKAALTFLAESSPLEQPESRQARQRLWNTQDYEQARRYFPVSLVYERQMLNHLANHRGDYVGAFHRLPQKLCRLFVEAYQSFLFNMFLSRRIQSGLSLKKATEGEYTIRVNDEEFLALPLIGYKQCFSADQQGEIEKQIVEQEGVTPERFRVQDMERISSAGTLRTALAPVIQLETEKSMEDPVNPRGRMMSIAFTLRKGSYATVLLRELMKPENPVAAGF